MKTIVIDVHDLLSPLSARGVEKQLAKLPGIKQVDVNSVSSSARVVYDETVTGLDAIKAKVRECGHHCCGELMPNHLCKQEPAPADAKPWRTLQGLFPSPQRRSRNIDEMQS